MSDLIEVDVLEKSTKRTKRIVIPISRAECNLLVRHTENQKEYKIMESVANKIIELQKDHPKDDHIDFTDLGNYMFHLTLVIDGENKKVDVKDMYNRIEDKDNFI